MNDVIFVCVVVGPVMCAWPTIISANNQRYLRRWFSMLRLMYARSWSYVRWITMIIRRYCNTMMYRCDDKRRYNDDMWAHVGRLISMQTCYWVRWFIISVCFGRQFPFVVDWISVRNQYVFMRLSNGHFVWKTCVGVIHMWLCGYVTVWMCTYIYDCHFNIQVKIHEYYILSSIMLRLIRQCNMCTIFVNHNYSG